MVLKPAAGAIAIAGLFRWHADRAVRCAVAWVLITLADPIATAVVKKTVGTVRAVFHWMA